MNRSTNFRRTLAVLAALTIGAGLATGCGSDDSGDDSANSGYMSEPAETTGTGNGNEVTPQSKKPASAGDKKKNAPDRAISKRPGGPESAPTTP